MKKNYFRGLFAKTTLLTTASLLVACNGGGGGSSSTYGTYRSAGATANGFVDALNNVDDASILNESEVILYEDETYRSFEPGQDEWFVIYDSKYDENKAVSLQYLRSIVYYDYYANNTAMAGEFRDIESDDILGGDINGDFWGDDYEVVDYNSGTDSFWGRNSGFEYEDENETTDVSLMAGEKESVEFFKKASNVSFAFSVPIETAMSLVTLGEKVETMIVKSQENLTAEDQEALMGDMKTLTGVSLGDIMDASADSEKKAEVVSKIAEKIGTSSENLENNLLPTLFNVEL